MRRRRRLDGRSSEEWNSRHRSEGALGRADRNFAELLQELRVLLTSVQILFGFLLTITFSDRFTELATAQRVLFAVTLASAAAASLTLVTPVAAHRILFRRNRKRELVRLAHRATLAGLTCLASTLVAGVTLVLDLALGRPASWIGGGVLLVGAVGLWWVLPTALRRTAAADPEPEAVHSPAAERDAVGPGVRG